jgi:hypothetical protein
VRKTAALIASVLVSAAFLAGTASADPTNANALVISFACDNGVTYDGTAIAQNHSSTGHVLTASDPSLDNAVFQAVEITVDDVIVKQIPGFAGVPLVNCTITAIGGDPVGESIVVSGFFTPRAS